MSFHARKVIKLITATSQLHPHRNSDEGAVERTRTDGSTNENGWISGAGPDESESADRDAVHAQRLDHRLEVGHSTGGAVTTAAGGETVSDGAGVERAAAVTGLGADRGADQAGDRTFGVVDGGVEAVTRPERRPVVLPLR